MKKNRVTYIITVILIIIAVVLILSGRNSTLDKERTNFALQDTASLTKIFLVDKNNNYVLLEKVTPSEWKLNKKYKAHDYQIKDFLKTMMDLVVRNPVPKVARNNVISRLSATAVKVEIYQRVYRIDLFGLIKLFPHEKRTKTYYVGGPTQDNRGTYMLMEGCEEPFIVYLPRFRGFVSARYSTQEDDWRDHTVFDTRLNDLVSVSVEFIKESEESYTVENLGKDKIVFIPWKDHQEKPYDTLRMLNFLTAFADIRFEAVLNNSLEPEFIDSLTSQSPVHIITLVDKHGDTNQVITFHKRSFNEVINPEGLLFRPVDFDRLYALINNKKDFVLIQYFVFDKILRPASYYFLEK
jgi:hypothetical protein